jgi:hypothetical protein
VTDLITRHVNRHKTDALIMRDVAVNVRTIAAMLDRITMQTNEGSEAMRDLILTAKELAADALDAAAEADVRARDTLERNTA